MISTSNSLTFLLNSHHFSEGMTYKGETYDQYLKIISYLEKQLELFSNLCFGRNYVNKRIMRQKLKSSVLLEYIWNKDLSQELRAAFVSLLLHIHIDSNPRTERIVPLKTKKFLFVESKSPTKKRNLSNIFMHGGNNQMASNKSPDLQFPQEKNQMKLHDVVLDITKISTITKTLQNKVKEKRGKQEYAELEEHNNEDVSSRGLQKEEFPEENEYKVELIEEFLKEEESIDDEQIKSLKIKIIGFLEKEIFKKPKSASKTVTIRQDEVRENKEHVNFDVLLLNMVQMIRKMVVCECFSFQDKKEPLSPQKNLRNLFGRPKVQQTQNEFEKLIKCLIIILEHQARTIKMKRLDTNKMKNQPGMITNIFGKINTTMQDAAETVKNVASNLGQIFFKDAGVKTKKNKKKKRISFIKLDSVSNFFICGMNVKKEFLKNLGQNEYENYDVYNNIFIIYIFLILGTCQKRDYANFALHNGYQT